MASGTIYLDVDDEITSAAQRIRGSSTTKLALVVPAGSRIATSRMNFRLLSREAIVNNRRLSIVAGDPATRALAASAGLPVFANVAEYETAIAPPPPAGAGDGGTTGASPTPEESDAAPDEPPPPKPASERRSTIAPPPLTDETQTVSLPPVPPRQPGIAAATGASAAGSSIRVAPRPERLPVLKSRPQLRVDAPIAIIAALAALALVVVGVAGFVFLPSAEIRLTPREEAIGPIPLVVLADPDATTPDANADPPVVPAVRLEVPVAVSDTFTTAGKRIVETAAKGEVTFRNVDFTATNTIAAGSIVSTQGGVRFRTNRAVTVPRARLVGLQIIPSEGDVAVTAVKKGTAGNVEPNTITVIPAAEDPVTLSVRNKAATTGGTHEEFAQVKQADIDKAMKALQTMLPVAFAEAVAAGAGVPEGADVFEETAVLGEATPSIDPATLLGEELETFDLELTATGSVIAVDSSPVEDIAQARLLSNVGSDHRLVEGSIQYESGDPTVADGQVSFPITARAARVALLDPADLRARIEGQSIEQARAILAEFGDVEINPWPDWVSAIPGIDSRVSLEIVGQGDAAIGPSPSPSGGEP